jgi:hypothetical protein
VLGTPTTDEVPLPDGKGKYRNYRGSLFGLHGNMASIRVSAHTEHPTCSHPERGHATEVQSAIYCNPRTGAHVVQGEIPRLWRQMR